MTLLLIDGDGVYEYKAMTLFYFIIYEMLLAAFGKERNYVGRRACDV